MTATPPAPLIGDGPPANVLPAFTGPHVVLLDTADFAAGAGGVCVYPDGILFTVSIRSTRPGLELEFGGPSMGEGYEPCSVYAQFSDGETVTGDYLTMGDTPRGLRGWGLSGGGGRWDYTCWVWTLPADGKLTVGLEVPGIGLAGSGALDLGDVAALAARARSL